MSSTAPSYIPSPPRQARFEVLLDELAELAGQRNAVDARIVDIVAEIDRDGLWSTTGCRSLSALVAWKTGTTTTNANTIAAVAHRLAEFPQCAQGMAEGRLSLDQLGVIAGHAGAGSDAHYAELAASASVSQLRTAVKLEPPPQPEPPRPEQQPQISKSTTADGAFVVWRIKLDPLRSATVDAALNSQRDALIADWKRDHGVGDHPDNATSDTDTSDTPNRPPMPNTVDAFMALIEAGWDTDVARRPHSQQNTVVAHLDVKDRIAALHLGPLLSDADRQYLTCDATCEVWFEREGQPIGAGRTTRLINRRLRRALEHRHPTCAVPGCGATRGLHAHHIRHWRNRTRKPGAGLPVSPSDAPQRRHHDHRTRIRPDRHRPQRATTHPRITRAPTDQTPTGRATVARHQRRTRPMVVVRPLPSETTADEQLASAG